jgi:hypothetical protein
MTTPDPRFQLLDPVDPAADEPDAGPLLDAILAVQVAPAPRLARRRPPRLVAGIGIASLAAIGAVAVGLVREGGGGAVAAAYAAVHQPDTILHYTIRTMAAPPPGSTQSQLLDEEQVWQAGDGSRQRVVSQVPGLGLHEEVVDRDRSLTYNAADNELVIYDEKAPKPAAPGGVDAALMGDPQTLLQRAQSGKDAVEELGEARVRGIDVLQFRVGTCHVTRTAVPGGLAIEVRSALVVSIAKDDNLPVRVAADCPGGGAQLPQGTQADYLDFQVLPATPANEHRLDMTPHPGAHVIDGEDVDAAEERMPVPPPPTPTPTPDGGAH